MSFIHQILHSLDAKFPFSRAESWDKVGLLVGDANAEVSRVLVCYEVTDAVLDAAGEAELIVAYHPLIFRPLENLNFKNHTARLVGRILAAGQNLICVHTALDGAAPPDALGDALAGQLGLSNIRVHAPSGRVKLVKIVTFVPATHLEVVSEAMWNAGAGEIGLYKNASFRSEGVGTFRPTEGATPYSGEIGELSLENEVKLEVIAPQNSWRLVVKAMKAAHPYEEVAFDVFALENVEENQGYGPLRVGEIEEISLELFAEKVKEQLGAPNVRIVKSGVETVTKVACSPGSGASFIDSLEKGTVFVTGDIKHHDALKSQARGVAIIDVTHAATETLTVKLIRSGLEGQGLENLQIVESEAPTNPFETF